MAFYTSTVDNFYLQREPAAEQRAKTPESSKTCQAVRNAVSSLYRLDDFDKECLGNGYFSDVYKVTHKVTKQVLVLKMNINIKNRPNMLREVQLMNQMKHPNILKFKGACVHEGVLHALTEFINGGSLESVLADTEVELDWALRMRFAVDMARGMRYLHYRGYMHRDLTSKNVLVRKEMDGSMTAIIGDFGLACKIPDPLNENGKALPIVGSPYWMAPECIHCQPYTEKADIFSYGIILCEIIARIEADPDILPRTSNFGLDYVEFSKKALDCPIHFLTLAYNCCQYDAKKRPTFSDICDRLEEVKPRSQMATVLADITNLNIDSDDIYNKTVLDRILIGKGLKRHMSDEAITIKVPDFGDSFNEDDESTATDEGDDEEDEKFVDAPSSPPKTVIPVTAQFVGEVMSKDDPFYTPCKDNPFTSRFKDATTKLIGSLRDNWAAWFEMPSPQPLHSPPPTSPADHEDSVLVRPIRVKIRRCHSLPGSPSLARKEIDRFQYERDIYSYSQSKRTISAMTNLRNMSAIEDASLAPGLDIDAIDALSEDSSSNDSALGAELKRREHCRSARALQRNLCDYRKMSLDPFVKGPADKYILMTRSMESKILDDALHNSGRYSHSSSESFTSLDESALLSPTSSYSSYSETDSDFWLSRAQFELYEHRLRSRQRFQELVRKWEANQIQAANKEGGTCGEGSFNNGSLRVPDLSHPRFMELRHKFESHNTSNVGDLGKSATVLIPRRATVSKVKKNTADFSSTHRQLNSGAMYSTVTVSHLACPAPQSKATEKKQCSVTDKKKALLVTDKKPPSGAGRKTMLTSRTQPTSNTENKQAASVKDTNSLSSSAMVNKQPTIDLGTKTLTVTDDKQSKDLNSTISTDIEIKPTSVLDSEQTSVTDPKQTVVLETKPKKVEN